MSDIDYHERRAAQERVAAGFSRNPAIGNIHRGLADRHALRAASLRESERLQAHHEHA